MKKSALQSELADELTNEIRTFSAPVLAKQVLDQQALPQLIELALTGDHLLSSRAMWVLGHCSDLDYDSIKKYHNRLIKNLENKGLHNGVIRNTLRLFQQHPVPKEQESFLLDKCYSYINDPSEAIAVRAFAIRIVFNISKPYPELLTELHTVLSHLNSFDEPPGIKSRVKNTIKDINKQLK